MVMPKWFNPTVGYDLTVPFVQADKGNGKVISVKIICSSEITTQIDLVSQR